MNPPDTSSLVAPLPEGRLDIVGDIHGEWDALRHLLQHLGYDADGQHPQGRTLVFVGDLCDRGPDTPAVLDWVLPLLARQRVHAILGNHEINLIRHDAKDGAGWAFPTRTVSDTPKYAPFVQASAAQLAHYMQAIGQWPVALERDDLRIVHAAWHSPSIAQARPLQRGTARPQYDHFEDLAEAQAQAGSVQQALAAERQRWPHDLEDGQQHPPLLPAHAERELLKQTCNPLKILTTGLEQAAPKAFFAGGKWRFTERLGWWDAYDESTPVVVGHYWRRFHAPASANTRQDDLTPATGKSHTLHTQTDAEGLFGSLPGNAWHGLRRNVFCVDFSVGARWSERLKHRHDAHSSQFRLGALRWPERLLVLDTGEVVQTV